jgi:polyhydroxyalkanoate synthesis repressor PhaR
MVSHKSGFEEGGEMAAQSRLIKKYPNRRLYDTRTSTYITLADVKELVLAHEPFQVVDAKSGDDLTRAILLQIILEEEAGGAPMFSSDLLSQMIRFYGNAMQGMMGNYIETTSSPSPRCRPSSRSRPNRCTANRRRQPGSVGAVPQVPGPGHAAHDGRLRRAEPEDVPADAGHHAGTDAQDLPRHLRPRSPSEKAEKK